MSFQDPFVNSWKYIRDQFTDQESRQQLENVGTMLASIPMAEIPGFDVFQLGSMFIDFVDPYGYSQAITRKDLDKILTSQFNSISKAQKTVADCYSGDAKACETSGIDATSVTDFKTLPIDLQNKRLKSITSWVQPYPAEVQYPDMLLCSLATSPERIAKCQDEDYKRIYLKYFNANAPKYQADAQAAYDEAVKEQAARLIGGDTSDGGKSKMIIALFIVIVLIIFIIVRKIVR